MTVRKFVKTKICYLALLGVSFFASCNSDDTDTLTTSTETTTESLTSEEVVNEVLADDISSDIDDIIEDDSFFFTDFAGKSKSSRGYHPDCLVRTEEETTDGRIVTLDYGEGCEDRRGNLYIGKIIITYVNTEEEYSRNITFENFSVNGNTTEGSKTILKVEENENGNTQKTYTTDITITLDTGEVISKKGEKIKEKTEGSDTDERSDDVISTSGSWESVNKDGEVTNVTITTNLRKEYGCRYTVSGVMEITKDENSYTIDFGDGSCDNTATMTDAEGTVTEITLRRRRGRH
jgi:hypothetical protein